MTQRRVTKKMAMPLTPQAPKSVDDRVKEEGLVEVVNTQRGRDQALGWGVYRDGKIYIVGTTPQHALLNLAQGRKVLNIPTK